MSFHHSAFNIQRSVVSPERAEITDGMPAPTFQLAEADGGTFDLSTTRDQLVLLIFFRRDW